MTPLERRSFMLAAGTALLAAPALAQTQPRAPRGMWFDPTQLPSFSGRLERWLFNPAAEVDRALLREGVQILFPPSEAEAIMAAVGPDQNFTAYGIRARTAPVVTMLAWARNSTEPATFVAQPSWYANERPGITELNVMGKVRAPLLNPQGDSMGVITEEGSVIRLTPATHQALGDRLRPGEIVAASGLGARWDDRTSLDAVRFGQALERLEPLPAETGRRP